MCHQTYRSTMYSVRSYIMNVIKNIDKNTFQRVARLKLLLICFKVESDIPAVKYVYVIFNVPKLINNFLNTAPSSVQYTKCSKNCTNNKVLLSL